MESAILAGNLDMVIQYSQGANLNNTLLQACRTPHLHIVTWLINNGATNLNEGLAVAARHDEIPIMEALADRSANNWNGAMNSALGAAFTTGAREWLIARGATDWNAYITATVDSGIISNVSWLITQGADIYTIMESSINRGRADILQWMLTQGCINLNLCLLIATLSSASDVVKQWLVNHGATYVNVGLLLSAYRGDLVSTQRYVSSGATEVTRAACIAARKQHWPILEYLSNYQVEWDRVRVVSPEADAWVTGHNFASVHSQN